ncbi:MAG: hypothetical protein ACYC5F_03860 [Thermoleophilia bacterium]
MSAGSVNQWGYCEICGEDFEDPGLLVHWHSQRVEAIESGLTTNSTASNLAVIGQDAA